MKQTFLTLIFFLTKLAVSAILVYLAYVIPGSEETSLRFFDYVIDIKTGLLAASAILLVIGTHYFLKLCSWLTTLPGKIRAYWTKRRLEKAKHNILESFIAMASGEYSLAKDLSGKAAYLDPDNIFGNIFFAQSSFMKGDYQDAEKQFIHLMHSPETRFLGLRGIISLRQKQHRLIEVKSYLEEILKERPNSPWALNQLFSLVTQEGLLDKAEELALQLKATKSISTENANRRQAIIYWLKTKKSLENKNMDLAETYLLQSLKLDPTLSAASIALAKIYSWRDKNNKARRCLQKGYEALPSRDYQSAIDEVMRNTSSLEQYKYAQEITSYQPDSIDSAFLLAHYALKAHLWGQCEDHLEFLKKHQPTRSYFKLLSELHTLEPGKTPSPEDISQMLNAPPDPYWACQECPHTTKTWEALCPVCHGFDSLERIIYTPEKPQEVPLIA